MMATFSENNIVYTEYVKFVNMDALLSYVKKMSELYKHKDENLNIQIDPKILELYIKITKYKIWIKEPYFTLN